jgi:ankyrin repeat protein
MAAIGGNAHIIRLLHSRGVTLNSKGDNEETPLMYACFFKKVEAVRTLCELGADVNAEDSHGKTALFFTVYDGTPENLPAELKYLGVFTQENRDIIHELLRRGANINKQTLSGMTVLMVAAQESPDSIRFLLENGADPNIIDNNFYSPLDYAFSYRIEANVRVLAEVSNLNLQVGPTRETTLMREAKINSTFVQILCDSRTGTGERRANLELKNVYGETALQYAAKEGSVQAVSILCEAGADVNTRENDQKTPLINTVLSLQVNREFGIVKEIIRTLLEHGADPTLKEERGMTFIECAPEDIQEEIQAIVDSVYSNINSFTAGGASRKRKARKSRKPRRKTRKARS